MKKKYYHHFDDVTNYSGDLYINSRTFNTLNIYYRQENSYTFDLYKDYILSFTYHDDNIL